MKDDRTLAQTFADVWPAMLTALDMDANPSSTIRPSLGESIDLPPPEADQPVPSGPEAVGAVLDRLGEGGMGVVDRVEQRSMGRWVARKTTRPGAGRRTQHRLLQEAWVSGFLEHPNIVPIYDIAHDAAGSPQILMREISGDDWESLVRNPARVSERFGAPDLLEWHLRVFIQVCNAVAYAHDKAIIHRDLKPENVMIGPFGEVWVLDWGLAVSVTDEHSSWIPRAKNERRLAGTPRFMAPEMIVGDGALLCKQTDVYLLGAILHEILTGVPPHDGSDLQELLSKIPDFRAAWPLDAPAALCRIADRALAPRPEDRHHSVAELRDAVQRWLDRRRAIELFDEATAQLQALKELIADEAERQELYVGFSTARFGFQQALREWPDHPHASEGLREAFIRMAQWELDQRSPDAADALLSELAAPPEALLTQLNAVREQLSREASKLKRLSVEVDHTVGVRTRIFLSGIVTSLWIAFPIYSLLFGSEVTWRGLFYGSAMLFVLFVLLALWARDSMSKSQLNRATAFTFIAVPIAQTLSDLHVALDGGTALDAYDHRVVIWAVVCVLYTATVSWRLAPAATCYALAVVVNGRFPEYRYEAVLFANLALILNTMAVWFPLWLRVVRREGLFRGRFRKNQK